MSLGVDAYDMSFWDSARVSSFCYPLTSQDYYDSIRPTPRLRVNDPFVSGEDNERGANPDATGTRSDVGSDVT